MPVNDPDNYFHRMQRGETAAPPIGELLGRTLELADVEKGMLRVRYVGGAAFANPAGNVAGGMLSAMLDDLTAMMADATVLRGQGIATISLNVSFLRPAVPGPITGIATIVRRGRELCHVNGMLQQGGKDVAWAVAICKVVQIHKRDSSEATST